MIDKCGLRSFVSWWFAVFEVLYGLRVFQLTSEKKIDKHLLPPKKIIGKNSKTLVEKRQKELEVYLQTLLNRFPVAVPKVLSIFLHFQLYVSVSMHLLWCFVWCANGASCLYKKRLTSESKHRRIVNIVRANVVMSCIEEK